MRKNLFVILAFLTLAILFNPLQSKANWRKLPKGYTLEKFKKEAPLLLGSSNAGKDFWCTFHPCWETFGQGNALYIFVSSSAQTTITLEIPGKGYYVQKESIPNDIIAFVIDPSVGQPYRKTDTEPPEQERIYSGAGIHIYADQPLIVYGCTRFSYSSDSYLALPVSSLGMDYIVASWDDIADDGLTFGQYLTSYTEVVAAYDDTKVQYTLGGTPETITAGGMKPGETTHWTLQKGDVLMFGSLGPLADLSGSRWISDKPVACYSGNFCAYVPDDNGYCDFLIEAELPIYTWGTEYHVTPIAGRLKNSYIRIFNSVPNNNIYKNGYKIASLTTAGGLKNAGWMEMRADTGSPKPIVISADSAISVTQYNCGQTDDNVVSDPFQLVLTPTQQFQKEITFNTPGIKGGKGFTINWINIVYKMDDHGGLPPDLEYAEVSNGDFSWTPIVDFSPDPGQPFAIPINGGIYGCKQLLLPEDGVYKIRANDPFCAYSYGFSPYDSYGHPTCVGLQDAWKMRQGIYEDMDTLPPDPQFIVLKDGSVVGKDSVSEPIVEDMPKNIYRTNLLEIVFHDKESFNYKFSYENFISGYAESTKWSAWVIDPSQEAKAVITFTDKVGNDTTITINHFIPNYEIYPYFYNYGILKINDTISKNVWLYNRSTTGPLTITSASLKAKNQGFELFSKNMKNINFPFTLQPNDSINFKVRFTNNKIGKFYDTISVSDEYDTNDMAVFESEIGAAIIDVSVCDFEDIPINHLAQGTIHIRNLGTVPLIINSFTHPNLTVFSDDLRSITLQSPLNLNPGQGYDFHINFVPTDTLRYADSMIFSSNTEITPATDSIAFIIGRGIIPVGIKENIPFDDDFTLYPNPVDDILTIQYIDSKSDNISLRIIDTYGNLVDELKSGANTQSINYNTSRLVNGLYIIQLNRRKELITKTFMILR